MADNLNKRPSKGILKTSSSFDRQETPSTSKKPKGTQWDEMNIIATLHPADKDYGHMKIDEPKTPYSYNDVDGKEKTLDPGLLSERLQAGAKELPRIFQTDSDSDEEAETPEQRETRKKFEMKRKEHYNEFQAMKLARKLLEEEEDEDDDENEGKKKKSPTRMDVDGKGKQPNYKTNTKHPNPKSKSTVKSKRQ